MQGEGAVKDADDCLRAAVEISNSGAYKCNAMQILIVSQKNLTKWAHYVDHYNDKYLLQFLVHSFSLSRSLNGLNREKVENYKSARDYPEAINQYLEKEMGLGAI